MERFATSGAGGFVTHLSSPSEQTIDPTIWGGRRLGNGAGTHVESGFQFAAVVRQKTLVQCTVIY